MNINQIYHTSHCGSTLMAALLANSAIVYSEPPWAYNLLTNKSDDLLIDDNIIIKFPSSYCNFAENIPGKKIFLYRKLRHHLFKIKTSQYIDYILSTKYEYHLNHCHPALSDYTFETSLEKIAFMWLNNIHWMMQSDNILWIETNSFLKNKKETMNTVCDYFELERIKNFEISNIYVKSLGIIGKETPINQIQIPNLGEEKSVYPSFGLVENDLTIFDDKINELVNWTSDTFLDLKEFLE